MLTWVKPQPVWEPMVLGQQPLTYLYTLINQNSIPVNIGTVGLEPGDDPRVVISGGTCVAGLTVFAGKKCTVEIMLHPHTLGLIKQVLYVHCVGTESPVWLELLGMVTLPSKNKEQGSYLVHETQAMYDAFRTQEQDAQRRWAEFSERRERGVQNTVSLEQGQVQQMKTHPYFAENQRFDGVEPNVTPNPVNNPKGKEVFQQEQEQQQEEKAERLGYSFTNTPKFNPKPQPS